MRGLYCDGLPHRQGVVVVVVVVLDQAFKMYVGKEVCDVREPCVLGKSNSTSFEDSSPLLLRMHGGRKDRFQEYRVLRL